MAAWTGVDVHLPPTQSNAGAATRVATRQDRLLDGVAEASAAPTKQKIRTRWDVVAMPTSDGSANTIDSPHRDHHSVCMSAETTSPAVRLPQSLLPGGEERVESSRVVYDGPE
ncbi:hypothetical protein GCM10025862_42280 [Arsenicicoccus piscis]|uniref:Uncharacterized protein n=1 Tax=Arsenicicoccus piscis TaxID=673954 RepID=A0ABQ6HV34_9MICO|nr:hypothetical protein GCM10025862_35430 [Arsenicicoccus piscis]GMA22158.1 hypothetical protein GCM10025862_41810 [Arsenicicoccus piscis]GMA22205.1 hypothetical protein GCM10025862_42280 [Arsenicicoccus piscis]